MSVWDYEREGDEFNLGLEQAYGFGFGKAEAVGGEDEFVGPGRRHQRGYSNGWSLLNVSMIALGDAVPFFTAWRVFLSGSDNLP
ncbi:MAG: hypothetical protein P0119_18710 [Nitrospira sp.]|nr:hypothetical protein [Nitrospira sp.]